MARSLLRPPRLLNVKWSTIMLTCMELVCTPIQAQETNPVGQLSPSGYWGAINTPTADVIPQGQAVVSLTNSNPERPRILSADSFGSVDAGVGLLPGLEGVARLAYEGDLSCSMYERGCSAKQRDLSASGKYQIPWRLPFQTRFAVGATDFGGAATHYRQVYGVATGTLGPVDASLGYSRAQSSSALLDGAFGSAAWRMTDQFTTLLEYDSQYWRGGLQYRQRLSRDVDVQLAASRRLSGVDGGQQGWQMTLALQVALGGRAANGPAAAAQSSAALASLKTIPVEEKTVDRLAEAVVQAGFAHVRVSHRPATGGRAALWQVQADPRRWRHNQLDAVAAVMATWLKNQQGADGGDEILLTLTYQRQPTLHAFTSAACLRAWLQPGSPSCPSDLTGAESAEHGVLLSADGEWPEALRFRLSQPAREVALAGTDQAWMPQLELGANLRTRVGTEVGLVDYSLAGEVGAEVALAPGLFWQGVLSFPLTHSHRFDDGQIFGGDRHPALGLDQAMLSYWRPLPHRAAFQVNAGYLDRRYLGGQVDTRWTSAQGRLHASALAGVYRHEETLDRHTPVLGTLRYSILPGQWQLEGTAGEFLSGDRGVQLASLHWWGDTRMKVFYSNSRGDAGSSVAAHRQMLGFVLTFPLGPRAAQTVGPSWVRGADRWGWGMKSKVGEKDNALTSGYAEVPAPRHGLDSDVSDFNRNGTADLAARSDRLREAMVEAFQPVR